MIKILIIDDAALVRQYLKKIIQSIYQNVEVLVAPDEIIGIEKINLYQPDIIVLDFEMPKSDSRQTLEKITNITTAPIIILSSLSVKGAKSTIDALNIGVFDFVCKPSSDCIDSEIEFESVFLSKIEIAIKYIGKKGIYETPKVAVSSSNILKTTDNTNTSNGSNLLNNKEIHLVQNNVLNRDYSKVDVVGIAISTGGPPIISHILKNIHKDFNKTILLVQHMPPGFTAEFAKRLNEISKIKVKHAENSEVLKPGVVYVAPGGKQMKIEKQSGELRICIEDGEKVSGHKPSADILFSSMAESLKDRCIGIIMTGMGRDGSDGLLELKNSGSITWGQKKETCVVYGMPKAALEKGAVLEELSVDEIIDRLNKIK